MISRAQELVNEQANDPALWFTAQTAPEAYLQQELRRLHAAVEESSTHEVNHQYEVRLKPTHE